MTREYREHAKQTTLDQQGVGSQSDYSFLFHPLAVRRACVVLEIVGDVRYALLGDETDDSDLRNLFSTFLKQIGSNRSISFFAKERNMTSRSFSRLTNPLNIIFLCLWLPLFGCAVSGRVDNRNFAVGTYYPNPNESQLARQRAQRYWQNNSRRFQNPTRYLAVNTTSVLQGDIVQPLYPLLSNSQTTGSYFSQGDTSELQASCIMIYDTEANKFVGDSGYLSVDLPPRGSIARWDSYQARYIGW